MTMTFVENTPNFSNELMLVVMIIMFLGLAVLIFGTKRMMQGPK